MDTFSFAHILSARETFIFRGDDHAAWHAARRDVRRNVVSEIQRTAHQLPAWATVVHCDIMTADGELMDWIDVSVLT